MTEDFYMKVGLAGTGWRAQMYVRVMKALGEEFEVSGTVCAFRVQQGAGREKFPGEGVYRL